MLEQFPIFRSLYVNDWTEYRKRRFQFFVVYLVVWPVGAVLTVAGGQFINSDLLAGLILAPCGIAFVFAAIRLSAFSCPRCDMPFFHRFLGGNPLTNQCLHCGLPKWTSVTERDRIEWRRDEDWQCLACNAAMPYSATVCSECGWSYERVADNRCDEP